MAPAQQLDKNELQSLLQDCFGITAGDRTLTFLVDLPDASLPDNSDWQFRRNLAQHWAELLRSEPAFFERVHLYSFPHAASNNADLPDHIFRNNLTGRQQNTPEPLREVLAGSDIVIALTELSATAPLKMLARDLNFRGASMPAFNENMLAALRLDYNEVHTRVMELKKRLDRAVTATFLFQAEKRNVQLQADIRFRTAHASSGLMREPGMVGNLPSGEAYIVPYEGEQQGIPSRTHGLLPVQYDDEVVFYVVKQNHAVDVLGESHLATEKRRGLLKEPARGNIAELGFGVLAPFGVTAVGSVLLDEKLAPHIAFGRSEHFGGVTSPASFSNPDNVIHIDHVYLPSLQPAISIDEIMLDYPDGSQEIIFASGDYTL